MFYPYYKSVDGKHNKEGMCAGVGRQKETIVPGGY
jgi:hypothetical protein